MAPLDHDRADRIATLERILEQQFHPLFMPLVRLWREAQALPDAWTYPAEEHGVSGFAGLAPIFVIGEQPSRSPWTRRDRGRRLLYDSLLSCGAGQAHLTDIIKSRGGPHEWRRWPQERLQPHIDLLHRELEELHPSKLILLGNDARELFLAHFPEESVSAKVVPHFASLRFIRRENAGARRKVFCETLAKALHR